jgi:hypothetical protein
MKPAEPPVPPAETPATPANTADYHSNPNSEGAQFSATLPVLKLLVLALTFLRAVPDFISAVAGLFTGQRAGHNRSKTNSFRTVALTASRIVKMLTRGTPTSDTVTPEYLHPNLWALFETPPLAQFREAR